MTATATEISLAYRAAANIEALVRAFDDCSLPRAAWTRAAHLTVALWYLLRHDHEEATALIRAGIQRYNAASSGKRRARAARFRKAVSLSADKVTFITATPLGNCATLKESRQAILSFTVTLTPYILCFYRLVTIDKLFTSLCHQTSYNQRVNLQRKRLGRPDQVKR